MASPRVVWLEELVAMTAPPLMCELCKLKCARVYEEDSDVHACYDCHESDRPRPPDRAHRCTCCGLAWVDSDAGYDTCAGCLARA